MLASDASRSTCSTGRFNFTTTSLKKGCSNARDKPACLVDHEIICLVVTKLRRLPDPGGPIAAMYTLARSASKP